ncbi:MAG: hypothetical protein IJQ53_05640 [Clostridia bacterium]|nr:hypothetical protein [Clostridia bacterium]
MKKTICILLLFCLLFLSSCDPFLPTSEELASGKVDDIYSVMAVSFIPASIERYLDTFKTVSEDEYGRKLFIYHGAQGAIGSIRDWVFVSQGSDGYYSYYYEDVCCQAITPEQCEEIKENGPDCSFVSGLLSVNDWQKPVDKTKCSKVRIANHSGNYSFEIAKLFEYDREKDHYNRETNTFHYLIGICRDDEDNQLYMVVETTDGKIGLLQAYIVKDDKIAVWADISVDEMFSEIHNFKKANGFGKSKTYTIIGYNSHTHQWLG